MSSRGRKQGTKNRPGHGAGGARVGAGRKPNPDRVPVPPKTARHQQSAADASSRSDDDGSGSDAEQASIQRHQGSDTDTAPLCMRVGGSGNQEKLFSIFAKKLPGTAVPSPTSQNPISEQSSSIGTASKTVEMSRLLDMNSSNEPINPAMPVASSQTLPNQSDPTNLVTRVFSPSSAEMNASTGDPTVEPDAADDDCSDDHDADWLDALLDSGNGADDGHDPKSDDRGAVPLYLAGVQATVSSEIASYGRPKCYADGTFWIRPADPFFALSRSQNTIAGLMPSVLYRARVFLWLPLQLCHRDFCLQCPSCGSELREKGWNTKPVARRVVDLTSCYYVMTKRVYCREPSGQCAKTFNLYDSQIMSQFPKHLAAEFPAYLTHRSGIDKTLMALIRAGIAKRLCAYSWSSILRELHTRQRDLLELSYLHAIKNIRTGSDDAKYERFSSFADPLGYAGFSPSYSWINSLYVDYMTQIRPVLDQCMSMLTGYILKWDHSFKIVKCMSLLDGVVTFAALFTVVNEYEEIRFQAFVPTKSLSHIAAGLKGIVASLKEHGHPLPIAAWTDNVGGEYNFAIECIPSLGFNVTPININQFSSLPEMCLDEDVNIVICSSSSLITTACSNILEQITKLQSGEKLILGFDMEWEFSVGIGGSGPHKTALIQLALPKMVYLCQVFTLKHLPPSLVAVLISSHIIKVGHCVIQDLKKLSRDFDLTFDFKVVQKSICEIANMARSRGIIANANASLASVTALTLQRHLQKGMRISQWSEPNLSTAQKQYAALDAWVTLKIREALLGIPIAGQSVNISSPPGQLVTIIEGKQEIAYGYLKERPSTFSILLPETETPKNIKVTKTRAIVTVTNVFAPGFILSYHKIPLSTWTSFPFDVLVNFTSLRTRATELSSISTIQSNLPIANGSDLPLSLGVDQVVHPILPSPSLISLNPDSCTEASQVDLGSDSDEDNIEEGDNLGNSLHHSSIDVSPYHQQQSTSELVTRLFLDIFHAMDRVLKGISRKHTAYKQFAMAFSDTMLVPDQSDKEAMIKFLANKSKTWKFVRETQPDWLWQRVRRFVPRRDLLYRLLKELFDAWGKIICSRTKLPLFTSDVCKKAVGVLDDVQRGFISDPPGISLYVAQRTDKYGFTVYRCLRGTNSVEGGVHMPIRRRFGSLNASVELADAMLADYRHRHNINIGTQNRTSKQYSGHYDTWIDYAIYVLQQDISWMDNYLPSSSHYTTALAFAPTKETFGISQIPIVDCQAYGFAPHPRSLMPIIDPTSACLPSFTHAHLSGKTRDRYAFLAFAQGTKYGVTPIHKLEEYKLFNTALSPGGEFAVTKPNFSNMASWWSRQANGQNIYYKLPQHLESQHAKWLDQQAQRTTMALSEEQRQPNTTRIQSSTHLAVTLPPSTREFPARSGSDVTSDGANHVEESSNSATDIVVMDLMLDNDISIFATPQQPINLQIAPMRESPQNHSQWTTAENLSTPHNASIHMLPLTHHNMPPLQHSNMLPPPLPNMPIFYPPVYPFAFMPPQHAPVMLSNPIFQAQHNPPETHSGRHSKRQRRRCAVCLEAQRFREADECPGRGNRSLCLYKN